MSKFRFILNGKTYEFTCEYDAESIRTAIFGNFPKVQLHEEYCICIDACDCENGHFVSIETFEYDDPQKPWEGKKECFSGPLQVQTFTRVKKGGKTESIWKDVFLFSPPYGY